MRHCLECQFSFSSIVQLMAILSLFSSFTKLQVAATVILTQQDNDTAWKDLQIYDINYFLILKSICFNPTIGILCLLYGRVVFLLQSQRCISIFRSGPSMFHILLRGSTSVFLVFMECLSNSAFETTHHKIILIKLVQQNYLARHCK